MENRFKHVAHQMNLNVAYTLSHVGKECGRFMDSATFAFIFIHFEGYC